MKPNEKCNQKPGPGNEATSLFFTKAPGEDFYKVYARYSNNPAWVPIAVTQLSTPDLQQVRDTDRNIAINSGSFEDAHLYLRSAEGNNMTSAFYTNASGGSIQAGNADGFSPLNLQPDGGTLTYGGEEVATKDWITDNDFITNEADPVYEASVPNQMMYKGIIPASANLNTYTTTGKWYQNANANAGSGTNYPTAYAGMLEVTNGASGDMIFQTYHTYWGGGDTYYQRSFYAGTWGAWNRRIADNEAVTWGMNHSGSAMNGYPGNSVLYVQHQGDLPYNGGGFTWNAALNNNAGIYSAQLYVGIGASTGSNPDQFWWRQNQQGGPGWPGPWLQVASRQWVDTATIKNQNASLQTANFRINGYAQVADQMDVGTRLSVYGDYATGGININTQSITINKLGNAHSMFRFTGYNNGDSSILNTPAGTSWVLRSNDDYNYQLRYNNSSLSVGFSDVYVDTGERLQVNGSIRQTSVSSSILKADSNGKLVAAHPGTDYLTAANLSSGSYTPTFSNLLGNIAGITGSAFYTRYGNIVTVTGTADLALNPTTIPGASYEISLPISSNLVATSDCSGLGTGTNNMIYSAMIAAETTTNNAVINFDRDVRSNNATMNFMFTYKVN